jgi:anhydro-N-acetylmuramic acid kinase
VQRALQKLAAGEALVGGVLSGTSGDGIDVALTRPVVEAGRVVGCECLAFETRPFSEELAPRVRAALDGEVQGVRELALLHRDLGRAFGGAVAEVAREAGVALDLCGSHGLTLYHHDGAEPSGPATLQLGDGDFVAEAAGCVVVSDFRQADLAAGGEGAPVSALADDAVFSAAGRPATILNLGGLANLTWLPAVGEPVAFDTGPAGALLDGLARRLLGRPYDAGGGTAARGRVLPERLERWMNHSFFSQPPPKSTGRDTFGPGWVAGLLEDAGGLEPADLLRTAAELVARTVVEARERHLPEAAGRLLVAGGGVHHGPLMGALAALSGGPVEPTSAVGVDPDAREALVFAVLAARNLLGEPVTRRSATGATPGRCLGKVSPGPARGR